MKKLFLIFFIISPYLLFGQYNDDRYIELEFRTWKFVSATNGLRAREQPELNARVYRLLPYGTLLCLEFRTRDKFTIDGITDYWYSFHTMSDGSLWIFGGYLTEYFETNPIVGRWANENDKNNIWIFNLNGSFTDGLRVWSPFDEDDVKRIFEGTYDIKNNTLHYKTKARNAKIRPVNNNKMEIIFDNETINLIRDNR